MTLPHTTTASAVNLVQPLPVANEADYTNQWITRATLTFDGRRPVTVDLGPGLADRGRADADVRSPLVPHPADHHRRHQPVDGLEHAPRLQSRRAGRGPGRERAGDADHPGPDRPGAAGREFVGPAPADLHLHPRACRPGAAPQRIPRRRSSAGSPCRRHVRSPSAGTARISDQVGDDTVDGLVGRDLAAPGPVRATSSSRMPGDLQATASATLDGDPATAWSPGARGAGPGGLVAGLPVHRPHHAGPPGPGIVSDSQHSRPTAVTVSTATGSRTVNLAPLPVTAGAGSVTTVPISTSRAQRQRLPDHLHPDRGPLHPELRDITADRLPLAVSEVRFPGAAPRPSPRRPGSSCRSDLLQLDGHPLWVAVTGSPDRGPRRRRSGVHDRADPTRTGSRIGSGTHVLDRHGRGPHRDGTSTSSCWTRRRPSAPPSTGAGTVLPPTPSAAAGAPTTRLVSSSPTSAVRACPHRRRRSPWSSDRATTTGGPPRSTGGPEPGGPVLIDGFANGWIVHPEGGGRRRPRRVADRRRCTMRRRPAVNIALLVSGATLVLCLAHRRHRLEAGVGAAGAPAGDPDDPTEPVGRRPVRRRRRSPSRRPLHVVVGGGRSPDCCAWALGGPIAGIVVAVGRGRGHARSATGRSIALAMSALLLAGGVLEVHRAPGALPLSPRGMADALRPGVDHRLGGGPHPGRRGRPRGRASHPLPCLPTGQP